MDALFVTGHGVGISRRLEGRTHSTGFSHFSLPPRARFDQPSPGQWAWASPVFQAISTAKRTPAPRCAPTTCASAAKEEAESAGAVFVKLGVTADAAGGYARELTDEERLAQQAALLSEVANSDIVITTAAVPGRKSPILVTTAMVEAMGEGSLVIDMAADVVATAS